MRGPRTVHRKASRICRGAPEQAYDFVVAGGGLHGGLVALAIAAQQPDATVAVVEAGGRLGGHHLWSFHDSDVPTSALRWMAPLIEHEWPRHTVHFPGHSRVVESGYRTMTSERLHDALVAPAPGRQVFLDSPVARCDADLVLLESGQEIRGGVVLDARGLDPAEPITDAGYQKFYGLEVVLETSHGIDDPTLIDARVEQIDGFRFVYLLPFAPDRLFVEDTYFSDGPDLDCDTLHGRVLEYVEQLGLTVAGLGRREHGVLPMPWRRQPVGPGAALQLGVRGGWYHPATAYSVPFAVRCALALASAGGLVDARRRLADLQQHHEGQARFGRALNNMLFRCFAPDQRVNVFERFYRLPESTIRRFYALEMTLADRARILVGRPPRGFSVRRALRGAG